MRMEDGSPIQLFTKVTTDGYEKVSVKEADGSLKDYWVMKKEDPDSLRAVYHRQSSGKSGADEGAFQAWIPFGRRFRG